VPCPCDHERRPRAKDLGGLAQDHLHLARVAVRACQLDRARRRLHLVEADDTALHLRDGLLGHNHDVAVLEAARLRDSLGEQSRQVVALLELGQPGEGDHPDLAGHGQWTPVTRRPACAL